MVTVSYNHGAIFAEGTILHPDYIEQSTPPATMVEHAFSVPSGMVAILEDNPTIYYCLGETSGTVKSEVGVGIDAIYATVNGAAMPSLGQEGWWLEHSPHPSSARLLRIVRNARPLLPMPVVLTRSAPWNSVQPAHCRLLPTWLTIW